MKQKMSKLIFYDVDGTLFRHDIRVPASAVTAVWQCAQNGHYNILCTGRNFSIVPNEVRALPMQGMVMGCGTYVTLGETVLEDAAVTGPDCRTVIELLYEHKCPFYVENSDFFYVDTEYVPPVFQRAVASMTKNYPKYMKHIKELPDRLSKITGYPEDRSTLLSLKNALSPWFDVLIHEEYVYIEILLKGYSKGTGVKQIVNALGAKIEDTYGFGDSMNDLPMLETVAHGIVMGDSTPELKERFTVTDSIYSDGIEKGLKQAGLI